MEGKHAFLLVLFGIVSIICVVGIGIVLKLIFTDRTNGWQQIFDHPRYKVGYYSEAVEFCAELGKALPLPRNKHEEKNLISSFEKIFDSETCNSFFTGYQRTGPRYVSLNGKTSWPSLNDSLSVALPSPDRDCVMFSLHPVRTIKIDKCENLKSKCFYYLRDDLAECDDEETCVEFGTTAEKVDAMTALEMIRKEDPRVVGIRAVDSDNYPEFYFTELSEKTCVALAVKYHFEYRAPDGSMMTMTMSNEFWAYNTENSCLVAAMGEEKKYIALAADCDSHECVVCA